MMRRAFPILTLVLTALLLAGCSSDSASPELEEHAYEPTPPVNPEPRGERLFGVTISESDDGFAEDFVEARSVEVQISELFLAWDAVETAEGVYQDPGGLMAATQFYATHGQKVLLVLSPLDTAGPMLPDHLDHLGWDIRALADAFNTMADWVLANLPAGLDIAGISIGNEVNLSLGEDEWEAYETFFGVVKGHLAVGHPDIPVGVKTSVSDGLFGTTANQIRSLNQLTDVVMLNYYLIDGQFQVRPPSHVYNNFVTISQEFPAREVWLTEVGYPSGEEFCFSSEDQQAAFFHEVFTEWDRHRAFFKVLIIDWLHDASAAQLAEWAQHYGSNDPAFLEFLGTLGVRTRAGEDKNAWLQIKAEAGARGWIQPELP